MCVNDNKVQNVVFWGQLVWGGDTVETDAQLVSPVRISLSRLSKVLPDFSFFLPSGVAPSGQGLQAPGPVGRWPL